MAPRRIGRECRPAKTHRGGLRHRQRDAPQQFAARAETADARSAPMCHPHAAFGVETQAVGEPFAVGELPPHVLVRKAPGGFVEIEGVHRAPQRVGVQQQRTGSVDRRAHPADEAGCGPLAPDRLARAPANQAFAVDVDHPQASATCVPVQALAERGIGAARVLRFASPRSQH
jgi:hypothetical protein